MSRALTTTAIRTATLALALLAGACRERFQALTLEPAGADGGPDDGARRDRSAPLDVPRPDGPLTFDVGSSSDQADDTAPCSDHLDTDPANCGACGNVCSITNALPGCVAGACTLDQCLPGFLDLNGMQNDGCEYQCTVTQGGTEVCDGIDNDCNGTIDDATDKMTDVLNCGACDHRCGFLHAAASCVAGVCTRGACDGGYVDANGLEADGCECAATNGGVEICDGIDNDCNGMVDDVPGDVVRDDPQHCGACSRNCATLAHATATCSAGACVILGCELGWSDLDQQAADGCENACPGGWPGGVEVCDGIDNDCDGKLDADDDSLVGVPNFCVQRGECAGSQPVCVNGGWVCNYGPTVETVGPNQIIGNETRCDGKDNDCDGCIDETFAQVGLQPASSGGSCTATAAQACHDNLPGECQGTGHYVCNAQQNGTTCLVTNPGPGASAEISDGMDNNCDGIIDNADPADPARVREPMVAISGGGLAGTVYVYAYEAARPDASGSSGGRSSARACSRPGVVPWADLTHADADAACRAAGKRLCTEAEWTRACQTAATPACTWSYASTCTDGTAAPRCNTHELDGDPTMAGDQDVLLATGAQAACYADWGAAGHIFDMTGNLKEWTAARATGVNPLRGGSYEDLLDGSTCTFSFVAVGDTYKLANAGFRCCSDTAP
jgi:hypothetical protein